MNVLTTTWRQLVHRRLWPVAVLLVAALAAVPVLLVREPAPVGEPAPTSPAANTVEIEDSLAEPVIVKATPEERSRRRRVLGVRKDPFAPAPVKKPKKAATKTSTSKRATDKRDTSTTTGGAPAPSAPSTGVPTVPVTPVTPAPPKKTYPEGSLLVRFGDPTTDLEKKLLRKLEGLPDGTTETGPLVIYTGLTDHGKKAVFLVDESLDLTGDGTCKPHPSSCETIELAAGETEFFDVIDPDTGEITAQYQIDVVKIN